VKRNSKAKTQSGIFLCRLFKDGVEDPAKRPLTFSFNGVRLSSVWLHLGLLGPRRTLMEFDGTSPNHYKLVDNKFSLLDQTDLVFIDPVSTGYSRLWRTEGQGFMVIKRILKPSEISYACYTTRYNRWLSPKIPDRESYGTTRACGLSGYLQERHGFIPERYYAGLCCA